MHSLLPKERTMNETPPQQPPSPSEKPQQSQPKPEQAGPKPEAAKPETKSQEPINDSGPNDAADIKRAAEQPGTDTNKLLADVADGSAFTAKPDVHGEAEQLDHPVTESMERHYQEVQAYLKNIETESSHTADQLGKEAEEFLKNPDLTDAPTEPSAAERAAKTNTPPNNRGQAYASQYTPPSRQSSSFYQHSYLNENIRTENTPPDNKPPEDQPGDAVAEGITNAVKDTVAETKNLSEKEQAAIQQSIDVGTLGYDLTNLVGPEQAQAITAQAAKNPDTIAQLQHLVNEAKYDTIKQARLVEASKATIETTQQANQENTNQQLLENMGENGRRLAELGLPPDQAKDIIALIAKNPDLVITVTKTIQTIPSRPPAQYLADQERTIQQELTALDNVEHPSEEQKKRSLVLRILMKLFVTIAATTVLLAEGIGTAIKDTVKK